MPWSTSLEHKLDTIYQEAVTCRSCFKAGFARSALVRYAQPRWVGPRYLTSSPRVAIVMLNPGGGGSTRKRGNIEWNNLLGAYAQRAATFRDVLAFQKNHMESWGRPLGRFLRHYTSSLGLCLAEIAFVNVALCATKGNICPAAMRQACFSKFTSRLLEELSPNLILLASSRLRSFLEEIRRICPTAKLVPVLHHSHRKGRAAERASLAHARRLICAIRGQGGSPAG